MWSSTPVLARQRPSQISEEERHELNDSLHALTAIFPTVRPEVFREMLMTLSRESRTQVVAEHILRDERKWVRGRCRLPTQDTGSRILREVYESELDAGPAFGADDSRHAGRRINAEPSKLLPYEETFRAEEYKQAVQNALRQEFKSLSRSTIQGVLAEQNYSYTLSRPILLSLAAKTWRASISGLFSRIRGTNLAKNSGSENHFMLYWTTGGSSSRDLKIPELRSTGNVELHAELTETVLEPIMDRRRSKENAISLELALLLNEQEAEKADATFECQVCYADVAFEQLSMCTSSREAHVICFGCIQRAMSEAVYGQSWELTIDHQRGQMRCIASSGETCNGCIPRALALRAIQSSKSGKKIWKTFERRVSEESLRKSGVKLVHCPFCSYAEVDALYLTSKPRWSLNTRRIARTLSFLFLGFLALVLSIPFVAVPLLVATLIGLPLFGFSPYTKVLNRLHSVFDQGLALRLRQSLLSRKFICRSPECSQVSCLECRKSWCDIHKCHESAALSLRTTIEAARTASLKRTCPRCGLGFVKDSGCNKMVCVCGYAMCYVCREGLGEKKGGRLMLGELEIQGQGYAHFCQHFRPTGGSCTECDKCDLYKSENEDEIAKRSGERAEYEWRERNKVGREVQVSVDGDLGIGDMLIDLWKHWTLQGMVDWWLSEILVCRMSPEPCHEIGT